MEANDLMLMYLLHNQQHIKNLINPYTIQYQELLELEDPTFFGDIHKQYQDVVRWTVARELSYRTNATVEDAFILLESFDIQEYLK